MAASASGPDASSSGNFAERALPRAPPGELVAGIDPFRAVVAAALDRASPQRRRKGDVVRVMGVEGLGRAARLPQCDGSHGARHGGSPFLM